MEHDPAERHIRTIPTLCYIAYARMLYHYAFPALMSV